MVDLVAVSTTSEIDHYLESGYGIVHHLRKQQIEKERVILNEIFQGTIKIR